MRLVGPRLSSATIPKALSVKLRDSHRKASPSRRRRTNSTRISRLPSLFVRMAPGRLPCFCLRVSSGGALKRHALECCAGETSNADFLEGIKTDREILLAFTGVLSMMNGIAITLLADKGSQTSHTLYNWLKQFIVDTGASTDNPVVLLLDNHPSRCDSPCWGLADCNPPVQILAEILRAVRGQWCSCRRIPW